MKRDGIGAFLAEIFVWWHGQTWGTRLALALRFDHVGEDEMGNHYWQERKGSRRWVTYNGPAEASTIPPGWHGWMHGRSAVPPTEQSYAAWPWQRPHERNLSGTAAAYRPEGSLLKSGERPRVTGDYDAWTPQ